MLLAGIAITALSVGVFYLPTLFAVVWLMVRDGPAPVPPGQDSPEIEDGKNTKA